MASAFITRLLERYVGAPGVTGFSLSFVDVPFQVADHVRLAGDGDGTHDTVVVSHVSPRRLERVHTNTNTGECSCFTVLCGRSKRKCFNPKTGLIL